eukprot:TRINITY_DN9215_c0_g1_i1.p1 TRINITY_DN9215_c0_g1~~TRINITY_DN9215_c0_g1_i1.p1  ORF type:complete len:224 (-),score=62.81 TRINITY_DN9215_c0_g1_i1:18-689(-)
MELSMVSPMEGEMKVSSEKEERLRNNLVKLKSKIIDTSSMVALFTKTKDNLTKTSGLLEVEKRENANLKFQVETLLKEAKPLREQLDVSQREVKDLTTKLQNAQSSIKSAQSTNAQLKAELNSRNKIKQDYEAMQKDVAKLKKDLIQKDDQNQLLAKKLEMINTKMKEMEDTYVMKSRELGETKLKINNYEKEISKLKEELENEKKKGKFDEISSISEYRSFF